MIATVSGKGMRGTWEVLVMAMTILNNPAAMMSLGELNKNISQAGRHQKKLSSGMKINSAGDDASGYAISERMRAQIRALGQDEDNVKKGTTLLNVAGGAVDNIIDELRHVKELAIDAANDHNTDADRAIIQKEVSQKLANIDDIASTTNFNGILLLDGRWKRPEGQLVSRTGYVNSTVDGDNIAVNGASNMFANSGLTPATANPTNGKTIPSVAWINGRSVLEGVAGRNYTLDFSATTVEGGGAPNMPDDMDGQGFYVVCAGNSDSGVTSGHHPSCPRSHSFVFDANLPVGSARIGRSNGSFVAVTVGIAGITDTSQLPKALYEGVKSLGIPGSVAGNEVKIGSANNNLGDVITFTKVDENTYTMKRNYAIWVYEGFPVEDYVPYPAPGTEIEIMDDDYKPLVIQSGTKAAQNVHLFFNDMHLDALRSAIPDASDVEQLGKYLPADSLAEFETIVHDQGITKPEEKISKMDEIVSQLLVDDPRYGTSSNYQKYMEYKSVIADAVSVSTLDKAKVTTQKAASTTIRIVDSAIEYALNEATYIGAYTTRLGFTEANIVTSHENSQSAESVIRDADMAKEMTGFAKSNILAQAAQSMLAQANQNGSQALSLLQ